MSEVAIRPMTAADVEPAVRVQLDAFADLDRRFGEEPMNVTDAVFIRSLARHQHLVDHDPGGAFVATVDGEVVGCALGLRRDGMWGLSLLNVDPKAQSAGVGRKLLAAALGYADGCDRAVIESSPDVRAIRLYGTSGFALFPQMKARGIPDVSALPQSSRVRVGGPEYLDFADDVDREVRGAAHGPDHALILGWSVMFVTDDAHGRGYAYLRDGDVYLLAASNDATATELLRHCLQFSRDNDLTASITGISGEQQWAFETCLAAQLEIAPDGPVFWRGTTPPRSYVPSGAFL